MELHFNITKKNIEKLGFVEYLKHFVKKDCRNSDREQGTIELDAILKEIIFSKESNTNLGDDKNKENDNAEIMNKLKNNHNNYNDNRTSDNKGYSNKQK